MYQSSHLARESSLIPMQLADSVEIWIKCGPYFQNKQLNRFYLSNEDFYMKQFSPVRKQQLTLFWILQGMFLFMVAFIFFMYLINKDQAYLYYQPICIGPC